MWGCKVGNILDVDKNLEDKWLEMLENGWDGLLYGERETRK